MGITSIQAEEIFYSKRNNFLLREFFGEKNNDTLSKISTPVLKEFEIDTSYASMSQSIEESNKSVEEKYDDYSESSTYDEVYDDFRKYSFGSLSETSSEGYSLQNCYNHFDFFRR